MGTLICRMLVADGIHVTAIDTATAPAARPEGVEYLRADAGSLTADAQGVLAAADWAIVTLPESVALSAWPSIVGHLRPGTLFVDTLSVKKPLIEAMSGRMPPLEAVSINPMFAPSLGFRGQGVAVIELNPGRHAGAFLETLRAWGATLAVMSADDHDRYAALLQAGTHAAILAFGLSLQRLHHDLSAITPIMTPPHRAMLALVARIAHANPAVYWDIQSQNPYAAEARGALLSGITELSRLVDEGDEPGFHRLLAELRDLFGTERLEEFNRYCARMFEARD